MFYSLLSLPCVGALTWFLRRKFARHETDEEKLQARLPVPVRFAIAPHANSKHNK